MLWVPTTGAICGLPGRKPGILTTRSDKNTGNGRLSPLEAFEMALLHEGDLH